MVCERPLPPSAALSLAEGENDASEASSLLRSADIDGMNLDKIISSYDPTAQLAEASTIPASWYLDPNVAELERQTVFSCSWQVVARVDQLQTPGQYVTCEVAGEPLVVIRGGDGILRGFFNVCRHHAAAVMTGPSGEADQMQCPYHG